MGRIPRARQVKTFRQKKWNFKFITEAELEDLFAQGYSQADIARIKNVHDSMVFRAAKRLDALRFLRIIGRLSHTLKKVKDPLVAPLRPSPQVDVIQNMLNAHADIEATRHFLDTPEGQELAKLKQIALLLSISDARMKWAGQFVDTRHKILELVAVDMWMRELSEMLTEVQAAHASEFAATGLNLREEFLARIREKILGRSLKQLTKDTPVDSVLPKTVAVSATGAGEPSTE